MKHKAQIPLGIKGEISYIQEELFELKDAHEQQINTVWPIIEASDIVLAVGKFTRRHYKIPLLLVLILSYCRVPYKMIRNPILDLMGVKKHKSTFTCKNILMY